jgi:hypothetical protein
MANPFPFVSGSILTAAELNGIGEAWTSYTPVIKGGATTVTATLTYAKYLQINKLVFVQVHATVTSTGATNGVITISLPTGLDIINNSGFSVVGNFFVTDIGVAFYAGAAVPGSATTMSGIANAQSTSMGSASPTMTLVSGDRVSMSICYEVA